MEKTFSTFIYSAGLPKLNVSSSTSFVPGDSLPRSSNDFINCLRNVRSLRNKISVLSALLLMDYFDIVAMTETWLDDDFIDSELLRDRSNRQGGSRLSYSRQYDLEIEGVEMLVCEIHILPQLLLISQSDWLICRGK